MLTNPNISAYSEDLLASLNKFRTHPQCILPNLQDKLFSLSPEDTVKTHPGTYRAIPGGRRALEKIIQEIEEMQAVEEVDLGEGDGVEVEIRGEIPWEEVVWMILEGNMGVIRDERIRYVSVEWENQ